VTTAAIPPPAEKGDRMTLTDLCLILGLLFAFGTLVLKIVEMARKG
jgi:hypothetical protein